VIYSADRLEGPWRAHPGNPILRHSPRSARPAGRMITYEGMLIRFAQDCEVTYGKMVRAFAVEELTLEHYVERRIGDLPILAPSGHGWNATAMHHVDLHQLGPREWIACVDGGRGSTRWPVLDRAVARMHRLRQSG